MDKKIKWERDKDDEYGEVPEEDSHEVIEDDIVLDAKKRLNNLKLLQKQ